MSSTRKTASDGGCHLRLCQQGEAKDAEALSERERTGSLRGRKRSGRARNTSSLGSEAGGGSKVVLRRQTRNTQSLVSAPSPGKYCDIGGQEALKTSWLWRKYCEATSAVIR